MTNEPVSALRFALARTRPHRLLKRMGGRVVSPCDIAVDYPLAKFPDMLDQTLQHGRSFCQVMLAHPVERWSISRPGALERFNTGLKIAHRTPIDLSGAAEQIRCCCLLGLARQIVGQVADDIGLADRFDTAEHAPAMDLPSLSRFVDDDRDAVLLAGGGGVCRERVDRSAAIRQRPDDAWSALALCGVDCRCVGIAKADLSATLLL